MDQIPTDAAAAVLQRSEPLPDSAISVEGPDFERDLSLQQLLQSYERIGFQANSLGQAINIVNRMVISLLAFSRVLGILHTSSSERGGYLTNLYPPMIQINTRIPK